MKMELSYITDWPKSDSNVCIKKLIGDSVCAWSCRNTVAFTAVGNAEIEEEREMIQPKIHIVDPDRPWELHSISDVHKDTIQVLQWDKSGTRLLSADVNGTILMWQMKQYLLNEWRCVAQSHLKGEPIVALAWLHNGIKIQYNVDNLDTVNMMDKFSRTKYSGTLPKLSAKPAVGWVAVTATGLISVTELKNGGTTHTVTECLGLTRAHAAIADIAYTSAGHLLISTSDGSCRSPIMVYKVVLKWQDDQCSISSEYLPSMHLQCCSDINNRDKYTSVTHLKFVNKECTESQGAMLSSEQLVICATGPTGSCVECWSLKREQIPLHKMFQTSVSHNRENIPHRQKWVFDSSFNDASPVTALALPKLPVKLSKTSMYNGPGMFLALAYQDGSIKLLHRNTLKPYAAFKYEGVKGDSGPQAKRQKLYNGKNLVFMEMSTACCSIVGLDRRGALCLIKIAPTLGQALDQGAARTHTITQIVNLLEYCMVTGCDWWDLLLTITLGMVDTVIDKLTEAFNRQSKPTQELLFTRFVALKACLHRLSTGGGGKSVDCYCKLLLQAIASVFRSLLRNLSTQDKGPAEKLTVLCSHSTETDLDKVMMNLDTKEFVLEQTTLQSLQHLIQFIADYSLSVLSSVPLTSAHSVKPGVSVLKDPATLCLLRELLVIIRIWGLLNKSCLPVFSTTSDSLDSLSLLFKLLTQVWMTCKDDTQTELDDSIIDECCLLPSQIMMQNLDVTPVTEGIIGKLHSRQTMSFEFDSNPTPFITLATFAPTLGMTLGAADINSRSLADKINQKSDIVRRLYLGTSPSEPLKKCTRCSCISLLNSPARTTPMKYWEQRWARSCLCGGLWKKVVPES
ncbi:mediator of RNA polymerase II transcription subunit 16-like [Amphiura filiformis]|uniref:mediator of RNA polymerase II transcription subunit 16-like n=1 Tax=Amphiura filiformis TaxID=82378 RepID=UPI003B20C11C